MTPAAFPKVLVWSRVAPGTAAGTARTLAACLSPMPAGRVEIVCERDGAGEAPGGADSRHPITRLGSGAGGWTPLDGRFAAAAALPWVLALTARGLAHVRRFQPDCLLTVASRDGWETAGRLLARLTGLPAVTLEAVQQTDGPPDPSALARRLLAESRISPAPGTRDETPARCPACAAPWSAGPVIDVDARDVDDPMFTASLREEVGGLRYRRCACCGSLAAVDGRRAPGVLERAYRHLPDAYWSDLSAHDRFARALERQLTPADGLDLWDVGCGDGQLLARLGARWRKHGIEPGAAGVAAARARALDVRQGTASGLGLREVADVVVCVDVIEHLLDPAAELEAMYRMLRPGGTVALFTGDAESRHARLAAGAWYYLHCVGHVTVLSGRALEALARRVGFEDVTVTLMDHDAAVGAGVWWRSWARSNVRRMLGGRSGHVYLRRDHRLLVARRPAG